MVPEFSRPHRPLSPAPLVGGWRHGERRRGPRAPAGAGHRTADRRARRPGSRRPATSSRWSAARCATRSSAGAVTDLDFTTDATPDQILAIVEPVADAHWDIGREFGTIGARLGDAIVEITTYRADAYDGASRKPAVAFGTSLEEDLGRRDFTVNAMALRLPECVLVDPTGGVEDLLAGVLRTPGAPEVSFGDDPLRMMRAARFTAQLGLPARRRGAPRRRPGWPIPSRSCRASG